MFKHLLNNSCPTALMLFEKDAEGNEIDPKVKLREQIAKGNLPAGDVIPDPKEGDDEENDEDDEEENEDEPELDADGNPVVKDPPVEETAEAKAKREQEEKIAAKATRKQDRMQRRIDDAIAAKKTAETEIANLKAQLAANPDQKLTAEEVETRANAIVAQRLKDKEIEEINTKFANDCDVLQKAAGKIDKEFDDKIGDIAEQFGPIPSFMIGVLTDMENGAEILAHFANDEDFAEEIYKSKPATMTKKLVELSNKLLEAKKPPKKQISKVPDPVEPVKSGRANGITVITAADTKPENMDNYVAKRRVQMAERRKAQGYN